MKFLLISYSEIDGVGQHVISLNSNLIKMGYQSKTLLLYKSEKENEGIIKIKRSFFFRAIFFVFEFLKKDFKNLFSFGNSTISFNSIKKYIDEADIVIIYSLHKIISFNMLEKIFKTGKIIYLRPLDMEFATGGCHVNLLKNGDECNKFELNCNACPQLNYLNIFNISNKIFNKKKKIIEKFKPKIFVENTFTKNIYDRSPISKTAQSEIIFLGTNEKRTKTISKSKAREILKVEQDDKIILFGTFNLDAPHKGGLLLQNILSLFILELNKKKFLTKSGKIKLITFGRKNSFSLNIPEIEWIHLGLINSNEKLNLLYRAADIFVSPSTGCNGPHIVVEALKNDLPVIAFDQGVAQDAIINGVNGYLVPSFNEKAFSQAITKVLFLNELIDKDNEKEKIKLIFSSSEEAKTISQHANKDLKNKNYNLSEPKKKI